MSRNKHSSGAAAGDASQKLLSRKFPGPRGAQSPLRVAVDRGAHADLVAHAKESLNAEICGVLAGRVCEDDEGVFVHVEAAIRGTDTSHGSTHVTFTHATWDAIYKTLERDHPDLRIVGWYHSHPGFGVEFSEMDRFIQKNFFSSPTQIALVMDPLSGAVAVAINGEWGFEYLPRYWVDGREQSAKVPASVETAKSSASEAAPASSSGGDVQSLEQRVGQLTQAVDDLRNSMYRFLMFIGALAAVAILGVAGWAIYYQMKARIEPPRNVGFAEIPVQIGDQTTLLGVQIVKWQLPPEMDVMNVAIQRAVEQLKKELEQAAAAMTNPPVPATTNPPAGGKPTTKP